MASSLSWVEKEEREGDEGQYYSWEAPKPGAMTRC